MRGPLVVVLVASLAAPALADTDYFAKQRGSDVVMRTQGSRTAKQKWVIAGLGAGAAVSAIAGVWFHLEAMDARDKVSADLPESRTWNSRYQDLYDKSHDSAVVAGVFYGISAALVGGTLVAMYLTTPEEREQRLTPVTIAPTAGGFSLEAAWRF